MAGRTRRWWPVAASTARRRREAGVTLSEILVGLGLAGLIAVAVLAVAQLHTSTLHEDRMTHQAQQNVRAALDEVVASLRACGKSTLTYTLRNGVPPAGLSTLPRVLVDNNPGDGPDALQVVLGDDRALPTLLVETDDQPVLKVDHAGGLRRGDLIVVTDLAEGTLFQLDRDPGPLDLAGIPAVQLFFHPPPVAALPVFARGALVLPVRVVRYQIDTTLFGGRPALVLRDGLPPPPGEADEPQVVAEDIVDLQVALGIDGLRTGLATGAVDEVGRSKDDDEWVFNYPGEAMPDPLPAGSRLALIRVTIVARTGLQSSPLGPGRPAVEDRPAGPPDQFRWRLLSTTIAPRSLVQQ